MTTDRKKLEEAIGVVRDYRHKRRPYTVGDDMTTNEGIDLVLAAAEAHLATLPKAVWVVKANYGAGDIISQWLAARDARSAARNAVDDGARKVEITAP